MTGINEAKNLLLLKYLETERSEKEAMINELRIKNQEFLSYKKTMVEERKRMENEKDAMINELRIKNQELLITKEKEEEEYKKMMVEDMKRMKSEKDAMINELLIKNQELLISKEKEVEECKKLENKCVELTDRFCAVETQCSFLKSLFDAENAIDQGWNDLAFKNEVIGVDDHTLNNTVADAIVISDESDAESDHRPRKSDITRQRCVGKKNNAATEQTHQK